MWRLLADENYPTSLIQKLRQRIPGIDLVRVQDVNLSRLDDLTILEWAASEQRILLTRDVATMPHFAYDRINRGLLMPGMFVHHIKAAQIQVFEDLVTIIESSEAGEWLNLVTFLPL